MAINLFAKIVSDELGEEIPEWRDYTISSPFRSDSNPSFRIYKPKDENDFGSAYDFGTGKAYLPTTFLMELKGFSYQEAVEYIYTNYGIQFSNNTQAKDTKITELIKLFRSFNLKIPPLVIEKLIINTAYNKSTREINTIVESYLPSPIYL